MIKSKRICALFLGILLSSRILASDLTFFDGDICAYLDPGTGSFIFQMLIAGFVGGLFALKLFWAHIKTFFSALFSRRKKKDDPK